MTDELQPDPLQFSPATVETKSSEMEKIYQRRNALEYAFQTRLPDQEPAAIVEAAKVYYAFLLSGV